MELPEVKIKKGKSIPTEMVPSMKRKSGNLTFKLLTQRNAGGY